MPCLSESVNRIALRAKLAALLLSVHRKQAQGLPSLQTRSSHATSPYFARSEIRLGVRVLLTRHRPISPIQTQVKNTPEASRPNYRLTFGCSPTKACR